jgi:hypothetical protein
MLSSRARGSRHYVETGSDPVSLARRFVQRWGPPPGGAVPRMNDLRCAANPQNTVIDDTTIFEVQLPATDEPGETARVRGCRASPGRRGGTNTVERVSRTRVVMG